MRLLLASLVFLLSQSCFGQLSCDWLMDMPVEPLGSGKVQFGYDDAEKASLGAISRIDSAWVWWDDDYGFWEYETVFDYGTHRVDSAQCVRQLAKIECLGLDALELEEPHVYFLQAGWELRGKLRLLLVEVRGSKLGWAGSEKRLVLLDKKGLVLDNCQVAHFFANGLLKPKEGVVLPSFQEGSGQLWHDGHVLQNKADGAMHLWSVGNKGFELADR